MKTLTKDMKKQRDELLEKLDEMRDDIDQAVSDFNSQIVEIFNEIVKPTIAAYNEVVSEINSLAEDIRNAQDDYVSERSEKWQESDAASQYQSWQETIEDAPELDEPDCPELEFDVPDDVIDAVNNWVESAAEC